MQTAVMKRTSFFVIGALLFVALVAVSVLAAKPAHAKTFTVNYTGDAPDPIAGDGVCGFLLCSLRAAIQEANKFPGADTINFNIPGSGVKTISPSIGLPAITQPMIIDGYSQSGAKQNTLAEGNDAVLKIVLSGASAGAGNVGLVITADNSTVKGLVINHWSDGGVTILSGSGNTLKGNYIGTDASGTQDLGNALNGVFISGAPNNTIGGTTAGARNLISGNDGSGVFMGGPGTTGNKVQGNYIGTDASGTQDLGNAFSGVFIDGGAYSATNNTIGGKVAGARNVISGNNNHGVNIYSVGTTGNKVMGNYIGTKKDGGGNLGNSFDGVTISGSNNFVGGSRSEQANTIAYNGDDGVSVTGNTSTSNRILRNKMHSNGSRGIDLGDNGLTLNDGPGDADTGPNNLQNFPEIVSITPSSGNSGIIKWKLESTPNTTFTIRLFTVPPVSDGGFTYIGKKSVTTDSTGKAFFKSIDDNILDPVGVTATATDPKGNTSEFS